MRQDSTVNKQMNSGVTALGKFGTLARFSAALIAHSLAHDGPLPSRYIKKSRSLVISSPLLVRLTTSR